MNILEKSYIKEQRCKKISETPIKYDAKLTRLFNLEEKNVKIFISKL